MKLSSYAKNEELYIYEFRAIEVYTNLTDKKREIIQDILKSYRKTVLKIANYQWKLFFQIGSFNRKANIKHIPSDLSERYKYTIQYHLVVPTLESFICGRKLYADVNVSRNLLSRAKWGMYLLSVKKAFAIHRYKYLLGKVRYLLTENKYLSHSPKLKAWNKCVCQGVLCNV